VKTQTRDGWMLAWALALACPGGRTRAQEGAADPDGPARAAARWDAPRARPALFVTAAELPALRAKLKQKPFATQWQRFLAHADRCLDLRLAPATHWLNHSRESLGVAGTTALAYLVTGDRRYGERAKRELTEFWGAF